MSDALQELLALEGVRASPAATAESVRAVAECFGVTLPADLVALWRVTDGLVIDAIDAEILGCAGVLELMRKAPAAPRLRADGLLPLFDERTSNYCCLALIPPLAPRMIHLPHDDGPTLRYRDLESGLRALLASHAAGESFDIHAHDVEGDFDARSPRSPADQSDARALLATQGKRDEHNHAAQLLDAGQLEEFARLLETEHFTRRDVRARLEKMQDLEVRKLLRRDRDAFAEFARSAGAAATAAGFKVEPLNGISMKIGGRFINLEMFFYKRHEPGAMDAFIARVRELEELQSKGRKP